MIQKLKNIFRERDKKRLLSNIFYLFLLQGANYILPLITLPYLVRVLGPEKFGLIMFAQAFIQYFVILTDYGFNLSATKEVSIYRDDKKKLSEIFSAVMFIKLGLFFLSFFLLTLIVVSFDKFRQDWIIYYLTFGVVLGQVLFPVWFFQGLEKMKYITVLNITAKLIFTISIFIFVNQASDYIYVPLINSLGFIIAGTLAQILILKKFGIFFRKLSFDYLFYHLKEGWHIFLSTISYNLYANSPNVFIGLILGNIWVAYFSVVEKIILIFRQIILVIFQVFYPYLAKLVQNDFKLYAYNWFKLFKLTVVISVILCALLFFIPEQIFVFVFTEEFLIVLYLLKFYSISLVLQTLMNLFGMQSMLLLGYSKVYGQSYLVFSLLFIISLPILLIIFKNIVVVILLILLVEASIVIYRALFLYKEGVLNGLFGYSK